MTTHPPRTEEDLPTRLNRLRKNYAQDPLYAWGFTATGSLFPCRLSWTDGCSPDVDPKIRPMVSWRSRFLEYPPLCRLHRLWRVPPPDLFLPFHLESFLFLIWGDRYQTSMGDSLNGAGITAAWSFAWVLMNTRRCLRIPFRRFGGIPLAVFSLFYANVNWIVYGSYYFLDADTARRTSL